jgi:hypothetical protein
MSLFCSRVPQRQELAAFDGDGQFIAMAISTTSPEVVVIGEVTGSVHFLRIEEIQGVTTRGWHAGQGC